MHPSPLTRWLPALLWMGVIFWFSSMPDLASGLPTSFDFLLRKMAHMTEFAVLAVLVMYAFHWLQTPATIISTLLLALGYAALDEWHQTFVVGREGAVMDVVIDSVGALIGVGLSALPTQAKNPRPPVPISQAGKTKQRRQVRRIPKKSAVRKP